MKVKFLTTSVLAAVVLLNVASSGVAEEGENEMFLKQVQGEYNLSKADYKLLLTDIADTQSRLDYLEHQHGTLEDQILAIDVQTQLASDRYLEALKLVVEKENELKMMDEDLEVLEVKSAYQKDLLAEFVRTFYMEENEMFAMSEEEKMVKLLLNESSVGESVQKVEYLALLSAGGEQILNELERTEKELLQQKELLEEEREGLVGLVEELDVNKENLAQQKETKERLLTMTESQEVVYQELLDESLAQQEKMVSDLRELNELVLFVEDRMLEEGVNFDPDNYKHLLEESSREVFEFNLESLGSKASKMYWPVAPDLGISAYFRNPADGYQSRFGVQHSAIDLPVNQGTPIRAAADGVVFKAKDNGYGYSYISIVHAGDLVTNYGHMNKILVEDGQFVSAGSIIGLSGGMPGTLGAGYMTTGPHLHFEVMSKGVHVDPMYYLPLEVLSEKHTGNMPQKYRPLWEAAVEKAQREAVAR